MKIIFIGIEAEKTFTHYDPESGERFRFHKAWGESYDVPSRIGAYLIGLKPTLFGASRDSILSNRGIKIEDNPPIEKLEELAEESRLKKEEAFKETLKNDTLKAEKPNKRAAARKKTAARKK